MAAQHLQQLLLIFDFTFLQQLLQGLVQGLGQQEVDRRANQNIRGLIKDLVRQTTVCNVSSTSSVRNWIREATLALRDEIEQLRQYAYEPEVSYSRRYR